ncbi:MAG TPA: phenylalanine--tRNA ligase beta subunit-related protein [Thermoanaerobaculia bacterium]|nr:phenylalanine--tRNA ligase beta subunit-related protein [Thermoanaerobaculia bacterium]
MRLTIAPEVLEIFPETVLGVALARGVDNSRGVAALGDRLARAQKGIPERFQGVSAADHPRIALWREAYRRFGAKPKDNPSSIENLVRRALKGQTLPRINTIVDIYNAVSLEALLPAGAEDVDAIVGNVELAIAGDGEPPVKLLGEPEPRPPHAGEVIYRDGAGAICRRWNWKEADRTKLTERTRNAMVVVEGLPPVARNDVAAAIEEIARSIRAHCGGEVETAILDRGRPSLEWASPRGPREPA